jgi:osmotically-inducible protein OsmY
MKILTNVTLILSLLCGSGCGSMLSATDAEPIKDDSGERTYGARMDDESIETKATVNINAADTGFRAAHLNVVSYNSYVLIVGQVPSQELKDKASAVVREIRRVRRIYNELEVTGNVSVLTRSSDTWITSKVKSALLASSETEGNRVKVVTENGVVYLLGLASQAEAVRIVDSASGTQGVRKVVRLFEYLD